MGRGKKKMWSSGEELRKDEKRERWEGERGEEGRSENKNICKKDGGKKEEKGVGRGKR